jgi:hypothetical protein
VADLEVDGDRDGVGLVEQGAGGERGLELGLEPAVWMRRTRGWPYCWPTRTRTAE